MDRRRSLAQQQAPRAIVLGCSDSRVPAEIVFDQGLGDLFVIRVAGNIVAPSQVASVEFAAERFGVPLVMVLGHTGCGAIRATLDVLTAHNDNVAASAPPPPAKPGTRGHLRHSIVDRIRPAIEPLMHLPPARDRADLERHAGRANVRAAANHLRHGSEILESLVEGGHLLVVGAEYSLETGLVEVFDGV